MLDRADANLRKVPLLGQCQDQRPRAVEPLADPRELVCDAA
jgi:hypothetical protein